jgi:hypothetical protein
LKLFFGGGLNEQQQPDIGEAAAGSYNFELSKDQNRLTPRAPFDLKGTATNAGSISGFLQLVKRDDSETTLVQAGTTVYLWDGASSFTNKGSCTSGSKLRDTYWALGDYLVITDLAKLTAVSKWDGTTFSAITTGLGSTLYAKYGIVRDGRMWLFNVSAGSDTPHLMVASAFEDPTSYSTTLRGGATADGGGSFSTGLEAFYMLAPDLRPINGVVETLAGDLIISTVEGSLFKLTGTSPQTYKWDKFYPGSQAVGTESIVSTGNDIMYMRKGGNIESLVSTQNYGDVAADDLSRWIPDQVKNLTGCQAVYDQQNQKVLFFLSNKVLVLFKDILYGGALTGEGPERSKLSPWSVYRTDHASGFSTNAVRYMRKPGTTDTSVYYGSSDGKIFDLNGTGTSGDGGTTSIQLIRKSRLVGTDIHHISRGNVQYRRVNAVSLNIEMDWADEYNTSTATVTLKGPGVGDVGVYFGSAIYFGGTIFFGQGFAFSDRVTHQNFSSVGRGNAAFLTLSALTSKNWQADNLELI